MPICQPFYIFGTFFDVFICRSDYSSAIKLFFNNMGTPSGNTGNSEDRCVHFLGDSQHIIDKAGIEVHIGAHGLINTLYFPENNRGKFLYIFIQLQFIIPAYLFG